MDNFVDKNSQFGQTPFFKIGRKTPDPDHDITGRSSMHTFRYGLAQFGFLKTRFFHIPYCIMCYIRMLHPGITKIIPYKYFQMRIIKFVIRQILPRFIVHVKLMNSNHKLTVLVYFMYIFVRIKRMQKLHFMYNITPFFLEESMGFII